MFSTSLSAVMQPGVWVFSQGIASVLHSWKPIKKLRELDENEIREILEEYNVEFHSTVPLAPVESFKVAFVDVGCQTP
jgi:hypothetical protein